MFFKHTLIFSNYRQNAGTKKIVHLYFSLTNFCEFGRRQLLSYVCLWFVGYIFDLQGEF